MVAENNQLKAQIAAQQAQSSFVEAAAAAVRFLVIDVLLVMGLTSVAYRKLHPPVGRHRRCHGHRQDGRSARCAASGADLSARAGCAISTALR